MTPTTEETELIVAMTCHTITFNHTKCTMPEPGSCFLQYEDPARPYSQVEKGILSQWSKKHEKHVQSNTILKKLKEYTSPVMELEKAQATAAKWRLICPAQLDPKLLYLWCNCCGWIFDKSELLQGMHLTYPAKAPKIVLHHQVLGRICHPWTSLKYNAKICNTKMSENLDNSKWKCVW